MDVKVKKEVEVKVKIKSVGYTQIEEIIIRADKLFNRDRQICA